MAVRILIVGLGAVTLAACGGGAGTEPVPLEASLPDPLAAAQAAYGITATRPPGFYAETDPYPDRLTLTTHVRASNVGPAPANDTELCTDDPSQAMAWATANAARFSDRARLTASRSAQWFVEVEHDLGAAPPAVLRSRTFRCAAIDRTVANADVVARINRTPLDAASVTFVTEYLYSFGAENTALNAILVSEPLSNGTALGQALVRVHVRKFAGPGGCDRLELWRDSYLVRPDDRLLRRDSRLLLQFDARLVAGAVDLCE